MPSVKNSRAVPSRETIALVERLVIQQVQAERGRILELLTEMDREKTQQMFALAQVEARLLQKIHEERQAADAEAEGRLRRCQDSIPDREKGVMADIEARLTGKIHEERQLAEKEAEARLQRHHAESQEREKEMMKRIKDLEGADPFPNFWTVASLALGVFVPLVGWVYSIHLDYIDLKVQIKQECYSPQKGTDSVSRNNVPIASDTGE